MKILLVEDARAVAALLQAHLISWGYDVVLAIDGESAVKKFREEQPDIVFMDIEMPRMNGFEAANRIRAFEATQKWAWTPIIFLTASDAADNLVTAIEAGGDDYLVKGISENVLHAKMKAMSRIATMRKQLSAANLKLEQLASRDGLTGLFNRRWMDIHVNSSWDECTRKNASFALLMLDVDNFKKFNDEYGHQSGDDCLRAIAKSIEDVVLMANDRDMAESAFAARYGGEEFAVVMPAADLQACVFVSESILDAVRKLGIPHLVNGDWGVATISMGIAHHEVAGGEVAALFREADLALYCAKNNGRNQYHVSKRIFN